MLATLDIVIVNWNSAEQLHDCLDSIECARKTEFGLNQVVVVDNASSDGSASNLTFPALPLTVIQNSINRGFAYACNQGAHSCASEYILFLNPDTRLFSDSLDKAIFFMEQEEHKEVGICGIQLVDDDGEIARSCSRFPTVRHFLFKMLGLERLSTKLFLGQAMSEWDHSTNRVVDQVIGAFFLVRRSLFKDLNGFDERFFVYFEEVDLSLRARLAGWHSYYLAEAKAYHKGGGTSEQVKAKRLFYSLRSRILYGFKHLSVLGGITVLLATVFIEPFTRAALSILRGNISELKEIGQAYFLLFSSFAKAQLRLPIKSMQ